jgi:peptide/nickel transport system ATP-binding protein
MTEPEELPPLMSSASPQEATRRVRGGAKEALLRIEDLCTWFPVKKGVLRRTVGFVRAVDGVDLRVMRGSTLALVGESGCGKTTVGRSILRLVQPTRGKVMFDGVDLAALPEAELRPHRRHIQMVFQDPMTSLDPRLRVRDIIAEGMDAFGIGANAAERTERVAALLKQVQLSPDHLWRFPHQFSGGQRQRIGIARALAVEPKLLICDEAVSALDVSIQAQILNLLGQLRDDLGLTYLFITHDLSVVRYLADEVAVMYLGRIVETGSTTSLFESPRHPYTQGLLAAVPSVDPDRRRVRAEVLGDVPSPEHPPAGCRFHTRCPFVFDRCSREEPELFAVPGGVSRCFLNDPNEPSR